MAIARTSRPIPEILSDIVSQAATLLRKEGQLARTEISENIGRAAAGVGLVVGGAVLLIPSLVILLQAAVTALARATNLAEPWWALIVGGVVLIVGLILLMVGINRFKARAMVPDRTVHQLQRDAETARKQMRQDDELHRAA
jgi:protein-S-isoprenylcysteine O-methyltransferase Ste14